MPELKGGYYVYATVKEAIFVMFLLIMVDTGLCIELS